MITNYKKSLASEEIEQSLGEYRFTALIEEDRETLSLLENSPYIISLKCTIKQNKKVLGIGRANSILSPKNKFIKNAVLYCWNASIIDGISKAVKLLKDLPIKENYQGKTHSKEIDIEQRDKPAFFTDENMPEYATEKQKKFTEKLLSKCDNRTKEEYINKLKSPFLTKFDCSKLINSLLLKQ